MRALVIAAAGVTAVGLLAGCSTGSGSASSKPADFTVTSAKPTLTLIDVGDRGASVGDYSTFSAAVSKDGQAFGVLYGLKLLVAMPGTNGIADGFGRYQNQLTFDLPDGTISVAGVQFYTLDGSIPQTSLTEGEDRSVVGGTGAYAGARGTVHTTSDAGGTRKQEFHFTS